MSVIRRKVFEVVNSTERPIRSIDVGGHRVKFKKNGSALVEDAGVAKELNDRYGFKAKDWNALRTTATFNPDGGAGFIQPAAVKFGEGAWITILLIVVIMAMFYKIRSHYQEIGRELSLHGLPPSLKPMPPSRVIIPISGVHRGIVEAVETSQACGETRSNV